MRTISQTELKHGSMEQLHRLCETLREEIFRTVSACGGHLSSNLGTVELTVALHRVFDFPRDKLIFDVGHQCYTHKLLSERAPLFFTLRQEGGISGFPKREESPYDAYGTGHAGTSVSAALGIAKARDLRGEDYAVIALIGDGSFQNGLVYEALNSLKLLRTNVLIVLNDNGMSISPTEGGTQEILDALKESAAGESVRLLEQFGLTYRGIVNGNDLEALIPALEEAKEELRSGSVLLHVVTRKGQGYSFAENAPTETHGLSPAPKRGKEYSAVLGEELMRLAERDERIVAVTAAMTDSLGLRPFFEKFPARSFDVGICEEHASVLAASMAAAGMKPYYAIYSTFLQRAFDEVIHDVCGQDLPVTFCIDRAGITGHDGETHQGIFDLSYLSLIPNLTIAAPKDLGEFRSMLRMSADYAHPLAIRYPRYGEEGVIAPVEMGKFELLHSTISDIILCAVGERCLKIAQFAIKEAEKRGIQVSLANARFVKPLDLTFLTGRPENYIVTLEDNVLAGGFGDAVRRALVGSGKTIFSFGLRDAFIPHGEPQRLSVRYGLDPEEIVKLLEALHARG